MTLLTIAAVGRAPGRTNDFPPDEIWAMPFDKRPQTEVLAADDDTLGQVLTRGLAALGYASRGLIAFLPSSIGFWRPEDEVGRLGGTTYVLAVVQHDGSAVWRMYSEVTVHELMTSARAGAVNGDPTRIYAVMIPPIGNGLLPAWPDLIHMLTIAKTALEVLALPGAVVATHAAISRWRRQSAGAVKAIETRSPTWADRGLDPYFFDRWLDDQPWQVDDLAVLLGCTTAEAEAVLWSFGFAAASSGLWRRDDDEEATMLSRLTTDLIGTTTVGATDAQIDAEVTRRFRHLATTGKAPAVHWDEVEWGPRSLPGDSAHQARSHDSFLDKLRQLGKSRN
jgi:hypothetical protein